jgi:uncharacterized protein YehS (DUF1456 family)
VLNNEILSRICNSLNISRRKIVTVFSLADYELTEEQVNDWFAAEEDSAYQKCSDIQLAAFLNGLIIDKRGKKDGPSPEPVQQITNNIIFNKLRIALNLEARDILGIMSRAGLHISKHELSAFFRKHDHKHYRNCSDQVLSQFLRGVELKNHANRN